MNSLPQIQAPRLRASRKVVWVPFAFALVATAGLSFAFRTPQVLEASSTTTLDTDGDGLIDAQEEVLGTYIDEADTDQDGFSDLEEIARASDPLDDESIPGDAELSIGLTARADDGVVTMVAPVYASAGSFGGIDLELGVVFPDGTRFELQPSVYLPVITGGIYKTKNFNSKIVLLEMPFPQNLIEGLGSISLYGTVEDPSRQLSASAAAVNLVNFSGVVVMALNAPPNYGNQPGIIYAPIVPDEDIPASWASGEICWQEASPVGMVGASTAYEVTKGLCTSSDTYCSPTDCKATVGSSLTLTDPSTLLGG